MYEISELAYVLHLFVVIVQLLPASSLRRAALQALLQKLHSAKEQKTFGRSLFTSIIEPAVSSGAGASISTSIRNMLW